MNPEEKIRFLRNEISLHNHNYYVLSKPIISDYEFDQLYNELIVLEDQFPEYYDDNSPSKRVGSDISSEFKSFPHFKPMLSLSNTYSDIEITDFDKRIKKLTNDPIEYVCELKYDGVSNTSIFFLNVLIKNSKDSLDFLSTFFQLSVL